MTTQFDKSSGNVFADLGLPNSEQELLKAKLTVQIYKLIKEQQLTQTKAAELLGTTQAQVSALMRCRPVSVSVGRLMEFDRTDLLRDRECHSDIVVQLGLNIGPAEMAVITIVEFVHDAEALNYAGARRAQQHPVHLEQRVGVQTPLMGLHATVTQPPGTPPSQTTG